MGIRNLVKLDQINTCVNAIKLCSYLFTLTKTIVLKFTNVIHSLFDPLHPPRSIILDHKSKPDGCNYFLYISY